MKLQRGDVVTFVFGVAIATVVSLHPTGWPATLSSALTLLCPGFLVGMPFLGLQARSMLDPMFATMTLAGFALANGVTWVLIRRLTRVGLDAKRATMSRASALLPVILALGGWAI